MYLMGMHQTIIFLSSIQCQVQRTHATFQKSFFLAYPPCPIAYQYSHPLVYFLHYNNPIEELKNKCVALRT
jgi:hypothetical protein